MYTLGNQSGIILYLWPSVERPCIDVTGYTEWKCNPGIHCILWSSVEYPWMDGGYTEVLLERGYQ